MPMPSMPPLPAMPHLRPRFIPTLTEVVDPASVPHLRPLPVPASNPEELVQAVLKQLAPALEAMVRQTVFEQLAAHKNQDQTP